MISAGRTAMQERDLGPQRPLIALDEAEAAKGSQADGGGA